MEEENIVDEVATTDEPVEETEEGTEDVAEEGTEDEVMGDDGDGGDDDDAEDASDEEPAAE